MKIPEYIVNIMNTNNDKGYLVYLVGGYIRDYYLKKESSDYDLCTNMPLNILKEYLPINIMKENDHRNTAVIRKNNMIIEISTFRGNSLKEDLSNRDFKMNSIACDKKGNIIDYFNGIEDINKKQVSLIKKDGSAYIIDPLRILRTIRFAYFYNFTIEDNTKSKMKEYIDLLDNTSKERIYKELKNILLLDNIEEIFIEYSYIFVKLIPSLKECIGYNQYSDYHIYDVYKHIIKVVSLTNKDIYIRLAALFHDIGKPLTLKKDSNDIGHFVGHAKASYNIFMDFCNTYKVDNKTKQLVGNMILYHENTLSIRRSKIYDFYKIYDMNYIEYLFDLKRCDILGQNHKYSDRLSTLKKQEEEYIKVRKDLRKIKYNGKYLVKLGFSNKKIGIILDDIKRLIIIGNLKDDRKIIDKYVLKHYK